MNDKVQLILSMIRSDVRRSKMCKEYHDDLGAEYNEGLAKGRLSTLLNLGLIDESTNTYFLEWIKERI